MKELAGSMPSCPFWLARQDVGEYTLALCSGGATAENTSPTGDFKRFPACPFVRMNENEVFKAVIIELSPKDHPLLRQDSWLSLREVLGESLFWFFRMTRSYLVKAEKPGKEGVAALQAIWEEQRELFIQRHSK